MNYRVEQRLGDSSLPMKYDKAQQAREHQHVGFGFGNGLGMCNYEDRAPDIVDVIAEVDFHQFNFTFAVACGGPGPAGSGAG